MYLREVPRLKKSVMRNPPTKFCNISNFYLWEKSLPTGFFGIDYTAATAFIDFLSHSLKLEHKILMAPSLSTDRSPTPVFYICITDEYLGFFPNKNEAGLW